jgi:type II secretory pathway component GspD/PulD (secretin)
MRLDTDTDSNVLSKPQLMVLDNEEANLMVGQEIPITTGETLGDNNSNPFRQIQRENVGVQLFVRPRSMTATRSGCRSARKCPRWPARSAPTLSS